MGRVPRGHPRAGWSTAIPEAAMVRVPLPKGAFGGAGMSPAGGRAPSARPPGRGRPWKHIWSCCCCCGWPWCPRACPQSGESPPGGPGWGFCSPLTASGCQRCPPGLRHGRTRCQRLVEDTERVGEEGGGKLRSSSTATPTLLRRVNMQEAATHLLVRGLYFSMELRLELPSLPPTA